MSKAREAGGRAEARRARRRAIERGRQEAFSTIEPVKEAAV